MGTGVISSASSVNDKRVCPICNNKFSLVEYAFHVQEEQLLMLKQISTALNEIRDITELTYTYMNEETEELNTNEIIPKTDENEEKSEEKSENTILDLSTETQEEKKEVEQPAIKTADDLSQDEKTRIQAIVANMVLDNKVQPQNT